MDALSTTGKQIAGSPSALTIAQLPAEHSAVGTAAKEPPERGFIDLRMTIAPAFEKPGLHLSRPAPAPLVE